MSHEWDSYYNNLAPLSCDPSTLKASEMDENISQLINNFTGPNEISDSMASLEPPTRNKSFDANFYSNPETGNSNSDCVFEETSWQGNEQLEKDFLPNCGNSDIPAEFPSLSSSGSFATCYSADLTGLKDDCGMLNSFLENYSDISSCSEGDGNETSPPCKLLAGTSIQKSKLDISMEHTSSEWLFNRTGSLEFPTDVSSPNVAETNQTLQSSSTMNAEKELMECAQDQTGIQECSPSSSIFSTVTTENQNLEDRNGPGHCKEYDQIESVGNGLPENQDSNIIDHKDPMEDGGVKKQGDNKQNSFLNVKPTCDDMANYFNETVFNSEMKELIVQNNESSEGPLPKVGKAENTGEGKGDVPLLERKNESHSSESPSPPNAVNDVTETELKQSEIQPDTREIDKSLNSNSSNEQDKSVTKDNNGILKEESNKEVVKNKNSDNQKSHKLVSNSVLNEATAEEAKEKNESLAEEIGSSKNESFENRQPSKSNSTNDVEDTARERHGKNENRQEDLKELVAADKELESEKSDLASVGQAEVMRKEEENKNKVTDFCEKVNPQPPDSFNVKEENLPKTQKSDKSDDWDCGDPAMPINKETPNPLEPCLQSHSLIRDTSPHSEEDNTNRDEDTNTHSFPDEQQLENQSPREAKSLGASMLLEETSKSAGEPSVVMYCEPLSWEASVSDDDTSNPVWSQNADVKPLQSCGQGRKHLQPVVVLKSLEASIETSDSYCCTGCQYIAHNVDNLIEHYHNHHILYYTKYCSACNVYIINPEQGEKHLCAAANNSPQLASNSPCPPKKRKRHSRTCNKCGVKFPLFYQYVAHMRTHTGVTPYRCNGCGSYFSQTGSLARHKSIPGRCKQIIFKRGIKHSMLKRKRHGPAIKNKSEEVKEDVAIAEEESPLQKDLIAAKVPEKLPECYINLVDISKTHCCNFCGKSFLTAKKARKHIRHLHKSDSMPVLHEHQNGSQSRMVAKGKFKCPICPRRFKYSYNRARHLRICVRQCIDGQKDRVDGKYQCPLCSSLFSFAANRHRHIKTVCIKDYIAKASKESLTRVGAQEKNAKTKEKSQSQENEQPNQSKEHHHKRRGRTNGPGHFKCHLCPAVFRYYSGMHRHLKKHELFKLTGKLFKYRNSASSVTSEQSTVSSAETDQNVDPMNTVGAQTSLSFSCQFCEKSFNTLSTLKMHEQTHQGDKPYYCLECGKGFKNHCSLVDHKAIHQRKLQCTVCKTTLSSLKELIQHRKTHSKKSKLQCPDCNQEFPFPVYLRRHLERHRKKESKLSQIQGQIKMKPQHLPRKRPPVQEEQAKEQLQCSLCKEVFFNLAEIREHFLTHVSGLSCPFCQQNFTDRRYLVRHMIRHTGYKPYSCTHCGKHFYREIYCRLHSVHCASAPTITEVKSQKRTAYPCLYCPRVFTKKPHQENHHYGHKANTLHLCTQCGQFFGNNKYKSHQKQCMKFDLNPGSSSSQSDLDKDTPQTIQQPLHNALPTSPTKVPFKCDHCDQTFRFKSLLMRHLVSHTGLQPYVCSHCGERFRTQTKCALHESSHQLSGVEELKAEPESEIQSVTVPKAEIDKKYNCRFCTRTFMKARNLRRHILTHNEVNPYRCKACDSCFSRYDHLKVHQTHCKGDRTRLEVCIPKISLDDVGKGWQNKYSFETLKKQETFDCQICLKSFSTRTVLTRHNSMFHLAGSFKCASCGSSFMHQSSLRKHMKKKKTCAKILKSGLTLHANSEPLKSLSVVRNRILQRVQPHFDKNSKYFCSFCPRVFNNSYQLRVHTYLHTGERPYSCDFCGEKFIRRDYLQRHFLKCTKKKWTNKVPCDECNGFFPSDKLEMHQIGCVSKAISSPRVSPQPSPGSPPKGFACANCSSRFLLFSQLQEHYLTAHKGETTSPPVAAAPLQHHLSKMMKVKEEPLEDSCNMPPSEAPSVETELDKRKDPLACPECNMTFINKAGLSGHLRVHKEVPFRCRICNKGFWNKNLLSLHQRKCRLEDNLEDDTAWQMEGPLKAHIDFALNDSTPRFNDDSESSGSWQNLSVPEEKTPESNTGNGKKAVQYQCSECEKTFTDGLMLISHLEEHGREEQEKKCKTCPKCKRVFASKSDLKKHMKIHGETKVKEILCTKCPKTFCNLSELEEHQVFHDPNRSFSCKVCHLRFRTKISLCEHFSKEHPENAFHCSYCSKGYSQKKSLYRHYSQCHQNERMKLQRTVLGKKSADKMPDKPPSSQVSTAGEDEEDDESDETEDSDSNSADYFPCHVCGKTFLTSESLEDHQLCHLGKKPHECAECGKCFYQASQLQQHQRMHKSEFQCQLCGRGFVSLFALRKHKHTHGRKRPYRCSKCHLSFKGPLHLAEHMATHREESFPCDICNCIFPSKIGRAEHRKSHSKSNERRLPGFKEESQKPPSDSDGFQREFKYRCGVCSERFKDPEELSEHGCLESKGRLYPCLKCDKHFLHASHLKKHNNSSHRAPQASGAYQCNRCNTSFSSSENFLSHLESHVSRVADDLQEERKEDKLSAGFKCPLCPQCFSTATKLIRHFPAHSLTSSVTRNKPPAVGQLHHDNHLIPAAKYECSECGQSFLGTDAFRQHSCSHGQPAEKSSPSAKISPQTSRSRTLGEEEDVDVTGEDFYHCPICAKHFSSKSSLLDHQNKQHSHKTVFKCKVCGKVFSLRRYLRKHEQRHEKAASKTTTKPAYAFRCTQCSAHFSTSSELSLHKRLHVEKEVGRHRCDMCYKSFSQLWLLWQHQESHVGQIVYECNECDKAFAFPHLLEEHQLSHVSTEEV